MPDDAWRERLRAEVPREAIPAYLVALQRLVAGLRVWRDDLVVPSADQVLPLLAPELRAHPELTLAYLEDARYAAVVRDALGAARPEGGTAGGAPGHGERSTEKRT